MLCKLYVVVVGNVWRLLLIETAFRSLKIFLINGMILYLQHINGTDYEET